MSATRNGSALACLTARARRHLRRGPRAASAPSGAGQRRATIAPAIGAGAARVGHARRSRCCARGELRIRQVRDDTLLPRAASSSAPISTTAACACSAPTSAGSSTRRASCSRCSAPSTTGSTWRPTDADAEDVPRRAWRRSPAPSRPSATSPSWWCCRATTAAFRLAWRMRAVTAQVDVVQYFVDARAGDVLLQYSDRQTQSAVGRATRRARRQQEDQRDRQRRQLHGARSAPAAGHRDRRHEGGPVPDVRLPERHHPARRRATSPPTPTTTGPTAPSNDAHVYSGYTYDYYFKRFDRRGLDNNNIRILSLFNPVRRTSTDLAQLLHISSRTSSSTRSTPAAA